MSRQPRHAKANGYKINLTSTTIKARPRKLRAKWSMQSANDLRAAFGLGQSQVANVEISIGLPPKVYDWLLLNSMSFVGDPQHPLETVRVSGRTYRVWKVQHGDLWKLDVDSFATTKKAETGNIGRWFAAIDAEIYPIKEMDDVVSLTPICAKLVVAPEGKACPWRRRKT
jgi:hypothetical protein